MILTPVTEVRMNEIKVKRLLLAGLAMFLTWIFAEVIVEQVIGRILFGNLTENLWRGTLAVGDWNILNHGLNIFVALLNTTLMVWLYASLRPMYGVGTKTALIISAWGVIWTISFTVNLINLGVVPPFAGLIEAVYESIELPIAMTAGASVYEGSEPEPREA
jgi:hypothetical protein